MGGAVRQPRISPGSLGTLKARVAGITRCYNFAQTL